MKSKLLAVVSSFILSSMAFAVSNNMTVSGRLLKPDGSAMNSSSVVFDVKIVPPGGTCNYVYNEQVTVDLSTSDGLFELALGTGTVNWGTLVTSFDQSSPMPCQNSTSYTPVSGDTLSLQIKFLDSMETPQTWRSFTSTIPLRSVPHAMYAGKAEKLGNNTASDFLLKPTGCAAGSFVSFDGTTTDCSAINAGNISGTFADAMISSLSVDKLINGTSKYFNYKPNDIACGAGQVLVYSASAPTGWVCGTQATGTLTSISVTAPLVKSGTAAAPSLSITQATNSISGYLSNTDWVTFNSKQSSNAELTGISGIASTGILQRTGAGAYTALGVATPLVIAGGNIGLPSVPANLISGTLATGVLPNSVVVANGNSIGAELMVGTNDSQALSLRTNSTTRMTIDSAGIVSVSGAVIMRNIASSGSTIDFSTGNLQSTSSSCGTFSLYNMKDGGSYSFAVKGGSASVACSFAMFSGAGTGPLTVHMPLDHDVPIASKHVLYTFLVMGGDVYVSWMPGL